MNVRSPRDEMAIVMPAAVSTYDPIAPDAPAHGFFGMVRDAVRWVVEMPRRRAMIDELSMLSDHELADIGLNRSELDLVFDRDFAAERNVARSTAASVRSC